MAQLRMMRGRIAVAGVLVALTAAAPAAAERVMTTVAPHYEGPPQYEERYLEVRSEFKATFGLEAAGRNLVLDGANENRHASPDRVKDSTSYMLATLHPPEPVAEGSSYSGGSMNSTVMCESGGDYSANTGNGYYGGYQFDSGTWDAYGDSAYGEANEAPPAVQDAAAARVPYDAWPNC
jgi:hypothetical protein